MADSAASDGGGGAGGSAAAGVANPFGVELDPASPLGGSTQLSEVPCLSAVDGAADEWALHLASRNYLLQQGYSGAYVDDHFCPIGVTYEYHAPSGAIRDYGYARVTYKVTFTPYLTWWQHHFPVFIEGTRPRVIDGAALVDDSGEAAFVPEVTYLPQIAAVISPEQVGRALEALIGASVAPITIHVGANVGKRDVRLYARTENDNPDSSFCGDRTRVGTIDVETGDGAVDYTGACAR